MAEDGCSGPAGLGNALIPSALQPFCYQHDYCWDLARTRTPYGYVDVSKGSCNGVFLNDLSDGCEIHYPYYLEVLLCSPIMLTATAAVWAAPLPSTIPSSWPYGDTPGEYRAGTFRLRNWITNGEYRYYDELNTITVSSSACNVPVSGDWNGNGTDDWGCRSSSGWWYLEGIAPFHYGRGTDKPVVGDWNGSGTDTVGVVRDGRKWYLSNNFADSTQISFTYGSSTDTKHVAGDWDGNGTDTPGLIRGNVWFVRNFNSGGNASYTFGYGSGSDTGYVIGDWDNSGRDGVGVVRGTGWYVRFTPTTGGANLVYPYGTAAGIPVAGNWNRT